MLDEKTLYSITNKAQLYDQLCKLNRVKLLSCSFCGKSQNEVKNLVAENDKQVYICNECVQLCIEVMNPNTIHVKWEDFVPVREGEHENK